MQTSANNGRQIDIYSIVQGDIPGSREEFRLKLGRKKVQYVRSWLGHSLDMVEGKIETFRDSARQAKQKQEIRSSPACKIAAAVGVEASDLIKEPFF